MKAFHFGIFSFDAGALLILFLEFLCFLKLRIFVVFRRINAYLQYFSSEFKIVPITMGTQTFVSSSDLTNAIYEAGNKLGKSYCVIASTDLSHFNNQEKANKVDGFVLEDIDEMNSFKLFEEVVQYNITMCGYGPVMTTIDLSKKLGKDSCEILAYRTSGDVTGDLTSVVGYASGILK